MRRAEVHDHGVTAASSIGALMRACPYCRDVLALHDVVASLV